MNILLLTNGVPYPPDSGPRVKTYQLIRYLAERHRVTLVSLAYDQAEGEQAAALVPFCAAVYTVLLEPSLRRTLRAIIGAIFGRTPYTVGRHASRALHDLLARLVAEAAAAGEPFDLVHADQIVMAPYAEPLPLPRLLDAHNAVWTIRARQARQRGWPIRWAYRFEASRLWRYESHICDTFEAITTVTEEDREALLATGAAHDLTVIPIGIDGEALAPVGRAPAPRAVLSLATPSWPPNAEGIAWFTREVYPLVRRAVPNSHFFICGAQPTPELRALADGDPAIEVTGVVNPRPYLEQAAVMIAPLRSRGGMRVMLSEALASGVPVVATSLACADLDLTAGEHVLVADTPSAFADAVALLLRDPDLGERIAAAARHHALERYDWHAVYPAVDHVYDRITARRASHPAESPEPSLATL
ncbi:MAG: glycosyltransferase [Chloroflexales bacterium]|nr:glycosyltransferase [Chloroflexales bacterium]